MPKSLRKAAAGEPRNKRALRRQRQEIITSVKLTKTMYSQVQAIAKAMDRSQSWILREALESWLNYHMTALERVASGAKPTEEELRILAASMMSANKDQQG